jgi:hypothetical protein
MQKHIEMDEPEETPDLEQTLFGVADPIGLGSIIGEDEIDEDAIEGELDEDLLTIAGEDEDEPGEEPGEEPAREAMPHVDIVRGARLVSAHRWTTRTFTAPRPDRFRTWIRSTGCAGVKQRQDLCFFVSPSSRKDPLG